MKTGVRGARGGDGSVSQRLGLVGSRPIREIEIAMVG
jgi:hypothetical protein